MELDRLRSSRNCGRRGVAVCAILSLSVGFASTGLAADAESAAPDLPELPPKVRDNLEIDRLEREIKLKKLRIQLEELQGPQDSELERKVKQLGDLEKLFEANQKVRELVRTSPELAEQYERVIGVDATPSTCVCLNEVRVHWIGPSDEPTRATLSFGGGNTLEVAVGGSVGTTACRLQAVAADLATIACGGAERRLSYFSPLDSTSAR